MRTLLCHAVLASVLIALGAGSAEAQQFYGTPRYQVYYQYFPDTNYWQPYYVPVQPAPRVTFADVAPFAYYSQWYVNPPGSANWYYQRYDPVTNEISTGLVPSPFRR